jgi:protein NrfD
MIEPFEPMINHTQMPLWEWWIVWYFFLGGIAGGAYFIAALIELVGRPADRPIARAGYFIAFPLILVCAVCLILDLGRPERFWHMIVYRKTFLPWPNWDSAISVGSYGVGMFGFFSLLSFVDAWANHRLLRGIVRKVVAILGAVAGFFLASYTGVLLSTTHIPVWADTPLLSALFAASSLSTGAAAIALLLSLQGFHVADSLSALKRTDNWAMIIEIVLLVAFLLLLGSAAMPLLSGMGSILLIGVSGVLGLLIPLALQWRSGFQGAHAPAALTMLTSLLILIGGFALRTVIVFGGQRLL